MAFDPVAQYRKTPAAPAGSEAPPEWQDEYEAFAAKDRVGRLRIRSLAAPVNSPGYNLLLNVVYDEHATHIILVYTILSVLVRGRNLQKLIFAIENELADFIQEYDPRHWRKPSDPKAPFIESIEIRQGENSQAPQPTKH